MKPRINYAKVAPGIYDAMDALDQYLAACGLDESLLQLVAGGHDQRMEPAFDCGPAPSGHLPAESSRGDLGA